MFKNSVVMCGKNILSALALFAGMILGSILARFAHLPMPEIPAGVDLASLQQYLLLSTVLMAANLAWLSSRLEGSFPSRWLSLAFLFLKNLQDETIPFTNLSLSKDL